MVRVLSSFVFISVIALGPLAAQDARANANQRRTVLRAKGDSVQRAPVRKNPAEVSRAREEQRHLRENVEADARRTRQAPVRQVRNGNSPGIRSASVTDSVGAANAQANAAVTVAPDPTVNAANATGVPRIVQPEPVDSVATIPARSRPRAAIMRTREQPNAPSFCTDGDGHPLYGREWCFERGFRLGDWDRSRARNIAVGRGITTRGPINAANVRELFGDELAERIEETRTALNLPDMLTTRWISTPTGGSILVLSSGSTVLAELVDRDRDGRADVVWLTQRR